MAHYVVSDLHGEEERFHKLLDLIGFSDSDRLYIIGDVVDRGPAGISLLREIMSAPNMTLILGNHDYLMLRYFSPDATEREIRCWNRNNNSMTIRDFLALADHEKERVLDFLRDRPSHMELTVNGKRFYLVHGFPGDCTYDEVWFRPAMDAPPPIPGVQVIVGHTPVCSLELDDEKEAAYIKEVEEREDHLRIFHGPGFIDIDCGCGYDMSVKALACLRLEDMKEFYVR
ncbi:MAG: fructose-bisphosphatase class III [Oscillospiraceae bacterium]|nr:fructose-bisphosphatase class III [Oscillospiraceae bacterium]